MYNRNKPEEISTNDDTFLSRILQSPSQSMWPMQSPLEQLFPSLMNGFPTTPIATTNFLNSPIFQQINANQPPIIQPISMDINNLNNDINNDSISNNLTLSAPSNSMLQQPMAPSMSTFSLPSIATNVESMLQQMSGLEHINDFMNNSNIGNNLNNNHNNHYQDIHYTNFKLDNLNSDDITKVMLSNNNNHNNNLQKEGLVIKSKRGRKRKIKELDNFVSVPVPNPPKKRGRKKKKLGSNGTGCGFIGIRTVDGDVKVSIPAVIKFEYELFGDACTDKIEDILQPKSRTRYVRGLNSIEKMDRRREQNRNAAARSRARKNAMISKVIQLHQENLGLRGYIAKSITEHKNLMQEIKMLEKMVKE